MSNAHVFHSMYTLYDRISGQYGDIIECVNEDDMRRRVAYAMQSNPFKNDLDVYYIGAYSRDTGEFDLNGKPLFICTLSELYSEVTE